MVLNNPIKKYLFSTNERIELIKKSDLIFEKIKIESFNGLLAEYAYKNNIKIIIRGLRNTNDFNYELSLEEGHRYQWESLEFIYFSSKTKYLNHSSSLVKSITYDYGCINPYVSLNVKNALEKKYHHQQIINLSGSIASGKSTIGIKIVEVLKQKGYPAHYIDLDQVVHHLYEFNKHQEYKQLQFQLRQKYGENIFDDIGNIKRKSLGEKVFKDPHSIKKLNEMLSLPIKMEIKKRIKTKKGFIFIDGTVIYENGSEDIGNNNLLLIHCPIPQQINRLQNREGLDYMTAKKRILLANPSSIKIDLFKKAKKKYYFGEIIIYNNNTEPSKKKIEKLISSIIDRWDDLDLRKNIKK